MVFLINHPDKKKLIHFLLWMRMISPTELGMQYLRFKMHYGQVY